MIMYVHWCSQLTILSDIAKLEPQEAYTAFMSGFRHFFTYHTRTIPGIESELHKVDDINTRFLPLLTVDTYPVMIRTSVVTRILGGLEIWSP